MKAFVVGLALLVGVSAFGQLGSEGRKAPRRTTRRAAGPYAPAPAAPSPARSRAKDPLAEADRLRAGTLAPPRRSRSSRPPASPYATDPYAFAAPYAPRPTRTRGIPRLSDPYALPRTRTRSAYPSLYPDSPYSASITPRRTTPWATSRTSGLRAPDGTMPRTRTRRVDGIYETGLGPSPKPPKPPTFRMPRLETEAQFRARTRPPVLKPAPKPRRPKAIQY